MNAIELILHCNCDEVVTLDDIINAILEHLMANAIDYKGCHTGNILWDTQ